MAQRAHLLMLRCRKDCRRRVESDKSRMALKLPQEHFSAPEPAFVTNMIRTQDDNPTWDSRHEEDAEGRGEASGDAPLAQWCRTTCDWPECVSRPFISRLLILRCSLLLFLIVVLLSYSLSNLTLLSSCQPRIAT